MTTPATPATPATIASRLALASGLDWGRWAAGLTRPGIRRMIASILDDAPIEHDPVPDPLDAAAYLADCERRGVEPGPMPALSWDGDGMGWSISCGPVARIHVGRFHATRHYSWGAWRVETAGDHGTAEQLATLARLVAAADGGA